MTPLNKAPHKPQKGVTHMRTYRLDLQEYKQLRQAAMPIMSNTNLRLYNRYKQLRTPQDKRQYLNLDQTTTILFKKYTTAKLLDIIHIHQTKQDKANNKKLITHNQRNIIIPKLQDITDDNLELITTALQQLENKYILQLDTDYTSKQSILESYQQVLYYKQYNIPLQLRQDETLIGNTEILERIGA